MSSLRLNITFLMVEPSSNDLAFLPEEYIWRMKSLLGSEAAAFLAHYSKPPEPGLRFNPLKTTYADISPDLDFDLTPLPWTKNGHRILGAESAPGLHPYHAAGLYYIQEPAAQAVAEILDPKPGERILDLAAAPGGKTTHIAGKMQNQGILLANEIHPKRVWDLAKNLERWGARNVLIANETPERLAERLPEFFDRVLVDAPCSGEGMFRKMPEAVRDWSPAFINGCAQRQTAILNTAALLVRPGGSLVYATCTFAPEEDEEVILRFLADHSDFRIVTPPWQPGFRRGILPPFNMEGAETPVRLWPHLAPGEGHFIALLVRGPAAFSSPPPVGYRRSPTLDRLLPLWESFAGETFTPTFDHHGLNFQLVKSYLYAVPDGMPELGSLKLIRPGWWLGSFKKDRFEPAHALAMALTPSEVLRTHDLTTDQIQAYLRREAVPSEGDDGWILVTLNGRYPLGWGKRVRGLLKNHYPKGLRIY